MTAAVGIPVADGEALHRAQRSAIAVFAIRIAGAGLAYGTQVLLARLMGRADYGIFATVWVWIAILGHGSLWGLAQSVCRFVPHHRARGEADLARGFLAGGLAFAALSAVATAAAGAGVLWLARSSIDGALVLPLALALVAVPLFSLQDYVEGVARSFGLTTLAIAPIYILRQGLVAALMAAAVLAGYPAEAWVAVACLVAGILVSLAVQAGLLLARIRRELGPGPRAFEAREWARASLPIAFVDLTVLGLSSIDVLLLGAFAEPAEVGIYFAATRILQFVVFAQYAASAATAQRFADAEARGDRATLQALVTRTARLTAGMTAVTALAVLAASPLLLSLFGPGFQASVPVLAVLAGGVALQSLFGPAEDLLNMLGAERVCALVSLAALAAAGLLCLALIPAYGTLGAAASMAACQAGRGAALSIAARRRLGVPTHILGSPR